MPNINEPSINMLIFTLRIMVILMIINENKDRNGVIPKNIPRTNPADSCFGELPDCNALSSLLKIFSQIMNIF